MSRTHMRLRYAKYVLYGTVPYRTVLYIIIKKPYGTVPYGTVMYCTLQYRTVRYLTVHTLERRGAALMEYDNDRREAPRIKAL